MALNFPGAHAQSIERLISGAGANVRATGDGVRIHVDEPDSFGAIAQLLMERGYHFTVDVAFEVPPVITVTGTTDAPERAVGEEAR